MGTVSMGPKRGIFDFSLWISLWITLGISEDNSTFLVDKWRINESYVMLDGVSRTNGRATYPHIHKEHTLLAN